MPTSIPTPVPTTARPTIVPTPQPSTLPTPAPTPTPWDIKNYYYLELGGFLLGLAAMAVVYLELRQRSDFEEIKYTRLTKVTFSVLALANEVLYIVAFQNLGHQCGREAMVVLLFSAIISLLVLGKVMWENKLSLDAEMTLKKAWLFGPVLLLTGKSKLLLFSSFDGARQLYPP